MANFSTTTKTWLLHWLFICLLSYLHNEVLGICPASVCTVRGVQDDSMGFLDAFKELMEYWMLGNVWRSREYVACNMFTCGTRINDFPCFFLVKHRSLCCVHKEQIKDLSTVKQTPAGGKGGRRLTSAELMHLHLWVSFIIKLMRMSLLN